MTIHPLEGLSAHVRYFKCFGEKIQGWQRFEPINIIVGRNNSGKSSLIDLLALLFSKGETFNPARHGRGNTGFELTVSEPLTELPLKKVFRENVSGGDIGINHWAFGMQFIGARAVRVLTDKQTSMKHIFVGEGEANMPGAYRAELDQALGWRYGDMKLVRISAERDILPERRDTNLQLQSTGRGVTNVVRAFITSDKMPTESVTEDVLADLNDIYRDDSTFDQINCLESDDGEWEIFLHEKNKGNIRLSESGSSLKTVFIVLVYARLLSQFQVHDWSKCVLCIEEPENNLHPSLLRRLLEYLANLREIYQFTLVVTTHSPICIDWSAKRKDSQIIHVRHDGTESAAEVSLSYKQNRGILEDLDVRASDILQSNGIIWVEGPTDRIYVNRWIELLTDGEIKEGLHYQIMFYAGKLLFHLDALPPDESDTLISLLSMNRNIALLMDSDRHEGTSERKPRMNLNRTKRRILKQFEASDGLVWVTEGREVENYISNRVLRKAGLNPLVSVGLYNKIADSPSLTKFKSNKIELSLEYAKLAILEDLDVLDLRARLVDLVLRIRKWNAIPTSPG